MSRSAKSDRKPEMQKGEAGSSVGNSATRAVKSMTEGNPAALILSFMLPLLLGNIFQQAYNMVDGMIVGQMLGADALAAVGSVSDPRPLHRHLRRFFHSDFAAFWRG